MRGMTREPRDYVAPKYPKTYRCTNTLTHTCTLPALKNQLLQAIGPGSSGAFYLGLAASTAHDELYLHKTPTISRALQSDSTPRSSHIGSLWLCSNNGSTTNGVWRIMVVFFTDIIWFEWPGSISERTLSLTLQCLHNVSLPTKVTIGFVRLTNCRIHCKAAAYLGLSLCALCLATPIQPSVIHKLHPLREDMKRPSWLVPSEI